MRVMYCNHRIIADLISIECLYKFERKLESTVINKPRWEMPKESYNIAHVMPWDSVGGTEQATLRIIQAVEGHHFTSKAFCLNDAKAVMGFFTAAGVPTFTYSPVEISRRRPFHFLRVSFRLAHEFKRHDIDLVHCADVLGVRYAAVAAKLARLPLLCHVRNRYTQMEGYSRRGLWLVDKFAFVSQETWYAFDYSIAPRCGVVIYDGIEIDPSLDEEQSQNIAREVRAEFGIENTTRIIGMVARVNPQKDYETLIRAARRVVAAENDVCFLIVGGNSDAEAHRRHYELVKNWLAANDVTAKFIFTDFRRDVKRLIRAMDIFVLCTHLEGLPLVLLEGMAQGKPVVATAVDGIPEIIINEQTGLLHQHRNAEELAAKLLTLLRNKELADDLGRAGQEFVHENFTADKFATQMISLYESMLKIEHRADGLLTKTLPQQT